MTIYEEAFDQGTLAAGGRNTADYPQSILESYPARLQYHSFAAPQAFDIEIDGRTLANDGASSIFRRPSKRTPITGAGLRTALSRSEAGCCPSSPACTPCLTAQPS